MDEGTKNDPMRLILHYFSPFLRQCLSLAMLRNAKLIDNHLSAICGKRSYLRYHIKRFGLWVDFMMDEGTKNDPMRLILHHFSPFLQKCLSLAMLRNVKLIDNHLSVIC